LIESIKSFRFSRSSPHCKAFCNSCGKGFLSQSTLGKHNCLVTYGVRKLYDPQRFYEFDRPEFTLRQSHLMYFTLHKIRVCQIGKAPWQVVVGYSILVHTPEGIQDESSYFGKKPMRHFLNEALRISEKCVEVVRKTNKQPKLTPLEIQILQSATHCTFCLRKFNSNIMASRRILHHHHTFGNATILPSKASQTMILCSSCNLLARQPRRLTCVFFSEEKNGTDYHFMVKGYEGSRVSHAEPLSRKSGQLVGLILYKILRIIDFSNFRIDGSFWDLANEMRQAGKEFTLLNENLAGRGLADIQELISSHDFPLMLARSKVELHYLLTTPFHDRRFARCSEETVRMLKKQV